MIADENVSATVQGGPVGAGAPTFDEAGTYFLEVSLQSEGLGPRPQPLELVVDVTGDVVSPAPTEEDDGADEEQAAPVPGDGPDEGAGDDTWLLVAGALGFGLLGVALGALAGRGVGRRLV